jgi:hypothetical protein
LMKFLPRKDFALGFSLTVPMTAILTGNFDRWSQS